VHIVLGHFFFLKRFTTLSKTGKKTRMRAYKNLLAIRNRQIKKVERRQGQQKRDNIRESTLFVVLFGLKWIYHISQMNFAQMKEILLDSEAVSFNISSLKTFQTDVVNPQDINPSRAPQSPSTSAPLYGPSDIHSDEIEVTVISFSSCNSVLTLIQAW